MKKKSFGIIPLFREGNDYQVLLMQSRRHGHWGFPKGGGEAGEDAITSARREFEEETGITDYFVIRDLKLEESWEYESVGIKISKKVIYFIGFVKKKETKPQDEEVSDLRWLSFGEARDLLEFDNKKHILQEVEEYLAKAKEGSTSNRVMNLGAE